MTNNLSIDREIDFMVKYELTADELFLAQLIFLAQDGQDKYLYQYFNNCNLGLPIIDLLTSLQEKGIINKSYNIPKKGTPFNPLDVEFNKTVIKSYLQHSQDLGMELFDKYPVTTVINGRAFSLRNITKLYKSMDEMCFSYGKAIHFNPEEHKHVMDLLEYGKENNLINSGICDFIESRQWLTLEQMKNGEMDTFNTNELI